MNPRISMITLGVDNLETAIRFYQDGLGFRVLPVSVLNSEAANPV